MILQFALTSLHLLIYMYQYLILRVERSQGEPKVAVCVFQAWPEDALEMVANKFLEEVDLEDDVRKETVFMCKHFHESVRKISGK